MNDDARIHVTFIGGEADLSRRTYRLSDLHAYIDVAVMPRDTHNMLAHPDPRYRPERVHCRYDRYIIRRLSEGHAVAILEHYR